MIDQQQRLFGGPPVLEEARGAAPELDAHGLGQCMTPAWAAAAIVEGFGLRADDLVLEPAAGLGAFLAAIPPAISAIGVEIDPVLAEHAERATGRRVIVGDFRSVAIDVQPTVLLGNPPFDLDVIDGFLDRARMLLPLNGRIGWILPAYAFQTAKRVLRYNQHFAIQQTLIPRNIFRNLSIPLAFAVFTKDEQKRLVGFALYRETTEVHALPRRFRAILEGSDGPVWLRLVTQALHELRGRGTVQQIFELVEPRAPRSNSFPRESVRKTLQSHFRALGGGEYTFPEAA